MKRKPANNKLHWRNVVTVAALPYKQANKCSHFGERNTSYIYDEIREMTAQSSTANSHI